MREIWKQGDGYIASNLGRIRTTKILKPWMFKGRLWVCLGKQRKTVARLVIEAFTGKSHQWIKYKDGNRSNCRLSNLQFVDRGKVIAECFKNGRVGPRGESSGHAKLNKKQVLEILNLKGVLSQRAIARKYFMSKGAIGDIHSGRTWSHLTGIQR